MAIEYHTLQQLPQKGCSRFGAPRPLHPSKDAAMSSPDPQAQSSQFSSEKPGVFAAWLAHRQHLARLHADLEHSRLEDKALSRQENRRGR